MMKGCQKEMIVLQTKESALFESAFFVLRCDKKQTPRGDMLAESDRIISEGRAYLQKRQKRGFFPQGSFVPCPWYDTEWRKRNLPQSLLFLQR